MILKIDTTDNSKITVEITDEKSNKSDLLSETRKKGSQILLPMIDSLLKKNKTKLSQITKIEVNAGPGSFTGTRVGVSVANALGFALQIPVNNKKGKIVVPIYEKSKFD